MSLEFDLWEEDTQLVSETVEPEEMERCVFAVKLSDEMFSEPKYICSHLENAGKGCKVAGGLCDYMCVKL